MLCSLSKVKGTFYKLRPVGSVLVNKVTETDIKKIILVMCQTYNISRDDLLGNRRLAELVFPRHVAIYFLRENLKLSFPRIAKIMKKKDHTTIFHAYNKIKYLIKSEKISLNHM